MDKPTYEQLKNDRDQLIESVRKANKQLAINSKAVRILITANLVTESQVEKAVILAEEGIK